MWSSAPRWPHATAVALGFLLLPIVAIFLRVPPGDLLDALGTDAARKALVVTAETNAISMVLILVFGTPTAYWVATRRSGLAPRGHAHRAAARAPARGRGHRPPRRVRPARPARRHVRRARDRHRVHQGGRHPRRHLRGEPFLRAYSRLRTRSGRPDPPGGGTHPRGGPEAASSSASPSRSPPAGSGRGPHSRSRGGIGEFGATIMFAGSLEGVTQTLSLAIYEQFDVDFDVALAISGPARDRQRDDPPAPSRCSLDGAPTSTSPIPLRGFDASVTLTVQDGATMALVGPSGAGKTTVLRVVAGLLRPLPRAHSSLRRRPWLDTEAGLDLASGTTSRVGYLFQEYALFPTGPTGVWR